MMVLDYKNLTVVGKYLIFSKAADGGRLGTIIESLVQENVNTSKIKLKEKKSGLPREESGAPKKEDSFGDLDKLIESLKGKPQK